MFGGLGTWEIAIIGFVVILLFGATKFEELGRGMGGFFKEFRSGLKDESDKDRLE